MGESFLVAVSGIESEFTGEGQKLFVQRYVDMISYFVENPLDVWIPKFFDHADVDARRYFAITIGDRLNNMDDPLQFEWWERWLKEYWQNRLNGVPRSLDKREVEFMLRWLPNLDQVFPDAVDLAVRMPPEGVTNDGHLVYLIHRSDLSKKHPEPVARLLVYLGQIDNPTIGRAEEKEIIKHLLQRDLPRKLKQQLKELAAKRGM